MYITNSYHVHVSEHIDAFSKLKFEAQFQHLSPGGAISYVEVPDMQNNLEAVLQVMRFIYDNIIYAELNTKSDYCQKCGWDGEIEIRPEEIEMQVFRSSGAGGQHINKTSSAVRLIHIPTGVVVSCQTERSQFQNRDNCMKMLRAKLAEMKAQQHAEKISDIKGVQMKIEWGSQIRSYVFMPYTLVKDTRTGFETGNIQNVMDGDIDGFINAYLTASANGTLKK